MSSREIVFRIWRHLAIARERIFVQFGWAPSPEERVSAGLPMFSFPGNWPDSWRQHFEIEQSELDALLRGYLSLFGYGYLCIGTPANWAKDPLTGVKSPQTFGQSIDYRQEQLVGNVKVIWELGRHQFLIPVAIAYALTGDEIYRDYIRSTIRSWIDDNSFGVGLHWCSSLEVALRLISWSVVHSIITFRDGPEGLLRDDSDLSISRSIFQQVWFVRYRLSRFSSANNHLIGELTGIWVACNVFDLGRTGIEWREDAKRELETEADAQIHSDGVNKEQAVYYHLWVLEYLLLAHLVGMRSGSQFSPGFVLRIERMAAFLRAISPPGGSPPAIGDADDGYVTRYQLTVPGCPYQEVLKAVDMVIAGESDSNFNNPSQKAFWYGMSVVERPQIAGHHRKESTGASCPAVFQDGGYVILGSSDFHVVFDVGPLGYSSLAAHGHADALSFCLAVDSHWWLIDPGTYVYHGEPEWRDYFRGTSAHNTVQIDGLNQSTIGGPFLWSRHATAKLKSLVSANDGTQNATGAHDGYEPIGVSHLRTLSVSPSDLAMTIEDEVIGDGNHEVMLMFNLTPEICIEECTDRNALVLSRPGTPTGLEIELDSKCTFVAYRGNTDPKFGWWSPALGAKKPATALCARWNGKLPVRFSSSIRVLRASEVAKASGPSTGQLKH
jgi:hypothetical protein